MSDPQEAATPSDPHSAEAPVWRDAWRTFQDPYLYPDAEKFPSPFESFVAGFMAAHAARDAEVAELRAERDGLLRLREVAHWECDCVPDLGPTHCHACSDAAGHPVEWADSTHGPSAEVAELRARVDPQADSLRQKLWEYLGTETYLCDRDASAWGYGTMSLDDFRLAREDDEFMDSVLDLPDSPMKGDNR